MYVYSLRAVHARWRRAYELVVKYNRKLAGIEERAMRMSATEVVRCA